MISKFVVRKLMGSDKENIFRLNNLIRYKAISLFDSLLVLYKKQNKIFIFDDEIKNQIFIVICLHISGHVRWVQA